MKRCNLQKRIIQALSGSLLVSGVLSGVMGCSWLGKSAEPPALVQGRLAPCPASPNCVNSEYPDDEKHYIDPLAVPQGAEALVLAEQILKQFSESSEVLYKDETVLQAIVKTPLMGFIDDVQFRVFEEGRKLHVRSSSRLGYSDLGANRKRVEAFRELIRASE